MKIKKELFVCNHLETEISFQCQTLNFDNALPPGSNEGPDNTPTYVPCDADLCPLIDESDFGAQIFKDVATIHDLTPQGTPVNLNKFHYTVTETDIDGRINFGLNPGFSSNCYPTGFDSELTYEKQTEDRLVFYSICVKYVGDCDGIIYPGEVKTCTLKNYIFVGNIFDLRTLNAADGATTTETTTTTQSNNAISTTPSTTPTQSSNVGVAGVQTSNIIPSTLSSSTPSSPLANILPSIPN